MLKDIVLDTIFSKSLSNDVICELNEAILNFFVENKIENIFMNKIQNINTQKVPLIDNIEKRLRINNRISVARVKEMISICQFLNNNGIEYAVVKGPVLSQIIYDNPYNRSYGDIDIVLLNFEKDCLKVMTYLSENDYVQDLGWGNRCRINTQEIVLGERIDHHEIRCVKGVNNMYSVEIKNTLSCIPRTVIGEFCNYNKIYNIDGGDINSFDLNHTFISLCSNTFMNSESRNTVYYNNKYLRHYCDLFFFIKKYSNTIDIENLCEFIIHYKLSLRTMRVLNNLLSLITYNKTIFNDNLKENEWINRIIKELARHNDIVFENVDDVFLDNNPSKNEIVNWNMSFVERVFLNCRDVNILDYKKYIINNWKFKDVFMKNKMNDCFSVNIVSGKYRFTVDKQNLIRSKYKIELLSNFELKDVMFFGFYLDISNENYVTSIFLSNAKYPDKYTTGVILIEEIDEKFCCDITELVNRSTYGNRLIFRISKVEKIYDDVYRELESATYSYNM